MTEEKIQELIEKAKKYEEDHKEFLKDFMEDEGIDQETMHRLMNTRPEDDPLRKK